AGRCGRRRGFREPRDPSRPWRSRSSRRSVFLTPDREGLTRAAQLLRTGGVIAFPTDTVYGLGAAADDDVARRRIYVIKGRPVGLPLTPMPPAESHLKGWVHADPPAELFIRRWWPGPLTLTLPPSGAGTLAVPTP